MKASNHIIQIDAVKAFAKIGVQLESSPIGARCVEELQCKLLDLINTDLLIACLSKASKMRKARKAGKSDSENQQESKRGGEGRSHEA